MLLTILDPSMIPFFSFGPRVREWLTGSGYKNFLRLAYTGLPLVYNLKFLLKNKESLITYKCLLIGLTMRLLMGEKTPNELFKCTRYQVYNNMRGTDNNKNICRFLSMKYLFLSFTKQPRNETSRWGEGSNITVTREIHAQLLQLNVTERYRKRYL